MSKLPPNRRHDDPRTTYEALCELSEALRLLGREIANAILIPALELCNKAVRALHIPLRNTFEDVKKAFGSYYDHKKIVLLCPYCGGCKSRADVGMANEEVGCPIRVCLYCRQNFAVVRWEDPESAEFIYSTAKL